MRKCTFGVLLTLPLLLWSCQNPILSDVENATVGEKEVTFFINEFSMEQMDTNELPSTRAAISSFVDYLSIALFDAGREDSLAYLVNLSKSAGDIDGAISTKLKFGRYKVVVVANRASGGVGANEIVSPTIINTSTGKVTDTFFAITNLTVSENSAPSISLALKRATAHLRFKSANRPAEITQIGITLTGGSNILNPTTGFGSGSVTQVSTFNVTGSSFDVGILTFLPAESGTVNATVKAKDSGNATVFTRTFNDIKMKRNYRTVYEGDFFNITTSWDISLPESTEWSTDESLNETL